MMRAFVESAMSPGHPALGAFGLSPEHLLGQGGEAQVYALGPNRVLRLCHPGAPLAILERRRDLLDRLAPGAQQAGLAIPRVLDQGERDGVLFAIETRLPGEPVSERLRLAEGTTRERLIESYLGAAERLGDLLTGPEPEELCTAKPLSAPTSAALLSKLALRSLGRAGLTPPTDDLAAELAAALPPSVEPPALVHLDLYPANVMAEDAQVTGVLDFGAITILADRRLNPLLATAFLDPLITLSARAEDLKQARAWLADRGLAAALPAVERWAAAFWAYAFQDDPALAAWGMPRLQTPMRLGVTCNRG
jgi:aminoglycoside phosphotransferase